MNNESIPAIEIWWFKDLIAMAQDGDKLNRRNAVHEEFLRENKEVLSAAKSYLRYIESIPSAEPK